jgi:hypothetical protein
VAKPQDTATENGKPTRNAPPPVIRQLVVAEEDGTERMLKKQVPAWVISGLIHIAAVGGLWLCYSLFDKNEVKGKTEPPTSTKIEDKAEKDPDLTNPDLGLDSDLNASTEAEKVTDANVEAASVENEAAGLPNHDKDFASQTANLGQFSSNLAEAGTSDKSDTGNILQGAGGSGGPLAMPGLQGRSGATKEKLLRSGGGNNETEAAVGLALLWLSKQQNVSGGYWEYDGSHKPDRIAATGMCLLPFLAAGETHMSGKRYKDHVLRGVNYLKAQIKANGQFGGAGMYSQAIATVALCEAAGMTRDSSLKAVAAKAVDFIIQAQAPNGSWGYTAGTEGDTSIVGWQIQALKSAKLAQIPVPPKCWEKASEFLESVSGDSGATYGYRAKGSTHTLTAVALLSRQYMGWTPRNPSLLRGVEFMWTKFPPKDTEWDMYYYYYATQVVHFVDGPVWHRDWNPPMRGMLLKKQITQQNSPQAKQADYGSWPKDGGHIGSGCGKLGTTALACLTLEVYYRHLPLYQRTANNAD